MQDNWSVLSDRKSAVLPTTHDMVEIGLFVVELALPLNATAVLLDFQAADGWPRTFTLFFDPAAGLILIHRQGNTVARHALPCCLPQTVSTGRLSFQFDAPGRNWQMRFDLLDSPSEAPFVSAGHNPMPLRPADLEALSTPEYRVNRHKSVLWFGLTRGNALPSRAPWIGPRTPIETLRGPVAAGNLQIGELVRTADGGFLPLRKTTYLDLPSCGSFAPVILRAPFFGQSHDLLVSADQKIALSGPEVEYLFNDDEVLADAGALIDGRTALADQRRTVTTSIMLEFDFPTALIADGCVLVAECQGNKPARRILHSYEVLSLMALLGRASHRRVA